MEIYTCSLCDWQSQTATDADAYRHLAEVHDLRSYRELSRAEAGE